MRTAGLLALAGLLASCAGGAPPPVQSRAPPAPVFTAPHPLSVLPAAPAPATPPAPRDTCGLAALGELAGKARTEIPIPVDLTRRRVVCEGCPMTQDLRPERQTIWYDPATNRITRTACG